MISKLPRSAFEYGRELFRAYGLIFFLDCPRTGFALFLVSLLHLPIAMGGLLGVSFGLFLSHALGLKSPLQRTAILYNSLLIGFFSNYLFQLDLMVGAIILGLACLTILITLLLESYLSPLGIPVLSLPFSLCAAVLAGSVSSFTNLRDATPYFIESSLLAWLPLDEMSNTFFRSLSAIYCMPDLTIGVLIFSILVFRSPIIASMMYVGFFFGYFLENSLKLQQGLDVHALHYFNYSLTFTALSTVFLVASRSSLALSALSCLVCALVTIAGANFASVFHIPVASFPFSLVCLFFINAIRITNPMKISKHYKGSPEDTIDQSRLYVQRHRAGEIGVFCPFLGDWLVQQSFDGKWTHKGNWRHALDFVKADRNGKTFKERGLELEDYYCFNEPVYTPINGYVVATCDSVKDNPIGQVENQSNWGNYVLVRSYYGFYALVAHLKKDSVCVKVGDYISTGTKIGLCGNSGYSQEPHIHLQVQYSSDIGAHTQPFHLLNYIQEGELQFHAIPQAGQTISPLLYSLALDRILTFRVGEVWRFHSNSGEKEISIHLDEWKGELFLADGDSTLRFSRVGAQFYFYGFEGNGKSTLAQLFLAAPRIPISYDNNVVFKDFLPAKITGNFFQIFSTAIRWILQPKHNELPKSSYFFNGKDLEITGDVNVRGSTIKTHLKIDPLFGIISFQVGKRVFKREIKKTPLLEASSTRDIA